MAQKNALSEWASQTRKLAKEEDYFGLEICDTVFDYLWLLDRSFLKKYNHIFADLEVRYHKDNPYKLFGRRKVDEEFLKNMGVPREFWFKATCDNLAGRKRCKLFRFLQSTVEGQIELQLKRYEKAVEVLRWQIFEIVDFMFEKVHMVDPNITNDEYLVETINRVCKQHRKKNPFRNGIQHRFGKYWKDKRGKWHTERRKRF